MAFLGGCTPESKRNFETYTQTEGHSREDRGEFLKAYKTLLATTFEKNAVAAIADISTKMRLAQKNRVDALEALSIKEKRLRQIHGTLLKAERTIFNAIVAFEGLMKGDRITDRQYRNYLSSLQEAIAESEGYFVDYEGALKDYKENNLNR